MKIRSIILAAAFAAAFASAASAQVQIKPYGFIRNYAHLDTHESKAGTADLFNYLPLDNDNDAATMHFVALTSRLGVDVTGYEYNNMKIGAKIETDFYSGVSGVTGTAQLRLRQAYLTVAMPDVTIKAGQAWHPLAADMPGVIALNAGSPFNPFSRTPLFQADINLGGGFSLTPALIWQMQYTSAGPKAGDFNSMESSADYIKYSCIPEIYLGLNYKEGASLFRAGIDVLTIRPGRAEVKGNITTFSPYLYYQYKKNLFTFQAKTIYAQAGEHLNLNGGYAFVEMDDDKAKYTPTTNSSSWVFASYGKEWQGMFFAGFVKNFGTMKEIPSASCLYFSKNSFKNMNSMWRISPTIARNWGKLQLAFEYEMTGVQYGDMSKGFNNEKGLYDEGLHTVTNHRLTAMFKYTF